MTVRLNYLAEISEAKVRHALIEGLPSLQQLRPNAVVFEYREVVGQVARACVPDQAISVVKAWSEYQVSYPDSPGEEPDNQKLMAAIWGLIGDGIFYPRLMHGRDGYPTAIARICLTERGKRLAQTSSAHPLHPGYLQRFRASSPHVPDDVVARLEDAAQCLARGLLRAAVVMVGLAAEETVRVTHRAMVSLRLIPNPAKPNANTRDLAAEIRTGVEQWSAKTEPKERLRMGLLAVDGIRDERNKASHPGRADFDPDTVEELLISATRQLPAFWRHMIDLAVQTANFSVT